MHAHNQEAQISYVLTNVLLCYSHLFAIANLSYTTMMDAKKDQCIVIRYVLVDVTDFFENIGVQAQCTKDLHFNTTLQLRVSFKHHFIYMS